MLTGGLARRLTGATCGGCSLGAVHHAGVGALTRHGAPGPRVYGGPSTESPKGYAISSVRSKSDGAGVRVGRWLAGEEEDAGGAMAGANWSLGYGFPGRQNKN